MIMKQVLTMYINLSHCLKCRSEDIVIGVTNHSDHGCTCFLLCHREMVMFGVCVRPSSHHISVFNENLSRNWYNWYNLYFIEHHVKIRI